MFTSPRRRIELLAWIFNGQPSEPPSAWISLDRTPSIKIEAINQFFPTQSSTFPNGQPIRRGRHTNLLLASSAAGRIDFLRFFRAEGGDITKTTICDVNVFHQALDGDTVRCLNTVTAGNINETKEKLCNLMKSPCDTGSTPVHFAVAKPSAMEALLVAGADPLAKNNGKSIALHYAGNREVAELLLRYGGITSCNQTNSLGDTPLHVALSHGLTDVVLVLLKNNADITLQCQSISKEGSPMSVTKLISTLEASAVSNREAKRFAEIRMLIGDSKPDLNLPFRRCSWVGMRTLCRKPMEQIATATDIPCAVLEEIICQYLGPFSSGEPLYMETDLSWEERGSPKGRGGRRSNRRRSRCMIQ